ncbi:MAG: hypothetical protein ACI82H_002289 [Alphaproteobacteria bacterium]|jgi:uncharacterized protein (TIGR02466 family)
MSETKTAPANGIEVRSLFATPLVSARVPMTDDDNARLSKTILAQEKKGGGVQHSNLSGWQSADDFTRWGGTEGAKVLGFARDLANQLTGDRAGNHVAVDWFINAWANVNRRGHANQAHAHPGAVWSGCYYVDDGSMGADKGGETSVGGAFEVMDPRGLTPAMYAPELAPALTGCQSMGGSEIIEPKTGLMLLFPAWLTHGVRPYAGEGTRISLAFNFALPMARA